jgi:hypothetical protein
MTRRVLEQNLRHLGAAELRRDLRLLPGLLTLQDGWTVFDCLRRIRRLVVGTLERLAAVEDLLAAVPLLDDPRHPYAADALAALLGRLPAERRPALALALLADQTGAFGVPSLRWARLPLPRGGFTSAAFARDGKTLAVGSGPSTQWGTQTSGQIKLWDIGRVVSPGPAP